MEENRFYPYMGGIVEEVKAGSLEGRDQETGQPRTFTWGNHIRVTGKGLYKVKLSGAAVKALVDTYKNEPGFRQWCEQC